MTAPPSPWPNGAPPVPLPPGHVPATGTSEAAPAAPGVLKRDPATQRILPGSGGRKAGSTNRETALKQIESDLQDLLPEGVRMLGVLIRQGNAGALKLLFETTMPKGRTLQLDGDMNDPRTLVDAVANGRISVSEFAALSSGLKTAIDATETIELKRRLDELEQLIQGLKH